MVEAILRRLARRLRDRASLSGGQPDRPASVRGGLSPTAPTKFDAFPKDVSSLANPRQRRRCGSVGSRRRRASRALQRTQDAGCYHRRRLENTTIPAASSSPDEGCGPCRGNSGNDIGAKFPRGGARPQSRRSANSPLRYATLARIADRSAHDSPTRSNSNQFNRMASRIPSASERNTGRRRARSSIRSFSGTQEEQERRHAPDPIRRRCQNEILGSFSLSPVSRHRRP